MGCGVEVAKSGTVFKTVFFFFLPLVFFFFDLGSFDDFGESTPEGMGCGVEVATGISTKLTDLPGLR